jgi:hypothetical protein
MALIRAICTIRFAPITLKASGYRAAIVASVLWGWRATNFVGAVFAVVETIAFVVLRQQGAICALKLNNRWTTNFVRAILAVFETIAFEAERNLLPAIRANEFWLELITRI